MYVHNFKYEHSSSWFKSLCSMYSICLLLKHSYQVRVTQSNSSQEWETQEANLTANSTVFFSKGITIGLAWHFITEYYTPAKKSLSQNTETTSRMADHRKRMLHVFHNGLPEFGCEDMIGHRSDDQLCLLSSKFKYIIFPVPTCIVATYWNITNPPSEQLQLAWQFRW